MTKLFCKTCGNIYFVDKKDKKLLTKCPRCDSISYTLYASAIHRYFKCEKCKAIFKISEVAARHFSLHKARPTCPRCKKEVISISTEGKYLKCSGQSQKKTDGINNSLDQFGLKTW